VGKDNLVRNTAQIKVLTH